MRHLKVVALILTIAFLSGCVPSQLSQITTSTKTNIAPSYVEERRSKNFEEVGPYPSEAENKLRKTKEFTNEDYQQLGEIWGKVMATVAKTKRDINTEHYALFSQFLFGKDLQQYNNFEYFNIHRDMKKAFQTGFRQGYGERNSDLVLGVNLKEAARLKALDAAIRLMNVYREKIIADVLATTTFQTEWKEILNETLSTFEEITAEGSPAESRSFLSTFPAMYENELDVLISCLKGEIIPCDLTTRKEASNPPTYSEMKEMVDEGFDATKETRRILNKQMEYANLQFHINDEDEDKNRFFQYSQITKKNENKPLMIADANVNNKILRGDGLVEQVNKISWLFVGQEMGRKFNHNLISRQELIEWIKRARSIMESKYKDNNYPTSIRLLRRGFNKGYGAGGENEWNRLKKETGLKI